MSSISIGTFQSPVGLIQVEAQEEFIIGIKFVEPGSVIANEEDSSLIRSCIRELEQYFSKTRDCFTTSDYKTKQRNDLSTLKVGGKMFLSVMTKKRRKGLRPHLHMYYIWKMKM